MAANRDREPDGQHVATSSDQRVDRSEWSFVHSETATRHCVTLPVPL